MNARLESNGWLNTVTPAGALPAHRWLTIFRTNLRSAYNAARWKVFETNAQNRPYIQWVHVNAGNLGPRDRPSHVAMHGKTLPIQDPFWDVFAVPGGFNCRCRLRSLSARQVGQRGIQIESSLNATSSETRRIGNRNVKIKTFTSLDSQGNPFTLETEPGFDFNPGKIDWQPDLKNTIPIFAKRLSTRCAYDS